MTKIRQPVEPFEDVNVLFKDNQVEVVASILMVPNVERAQVGLALDASISMKPIYGISNVVDNSFFKNFQKKNLIEESTRSMGSYLVNFAGDDHISLIYWACGPDGSEIEKIGKLDATSLKSISVQGPKEKTWGRGTKLLPPVKYFLEKEMPSSPWSLILFITNGVIEDLKQVKEYSFQLGQRIATGSKDFVKLLLLGIGDQVDQAQMEELDDMFEDSGLRDLDNNEIDLWCHKHVNDMKRLEEIFAEVVSEHLIVAVKGAVFDAQGNKVKDYPEGLPAKLRFRLPKTSTFFTVKYPGGKIIQNISEAFSA